MLLSMSSYDLWRTQEPPDYSDVCEEVEAEVKAGDWDGDLWEMLEERGAAALEEVCDAVRRRFGDDGLQDVLWATESAQRLREQLIEDRIREVAGP